MSKSTEIGKDLGTIGNYHVSALFINKTSFPTVEKWDGTKMTEQRIMARQTKKIITLTTKSGDIVVLTAYQHRGETKYKDSRTKKPIDANEAHSELMRMLDIPQDFAKRLISLTSLTDNGETETETE